MDTTRRARGEIERLGVGFCRYMGGRTQELDAVAEKAKKIGISETEGKKKEDMERREGEGV